MNKNQPKPLDAKILATINTRVEQTYLLYASFDWEQTNNFDKQAAQLDNLNQYNKTLRRTMGYVNKHLARNAKNYGISYGVFGKHHSQGPYSPTHVATVENPGLNPALITTNVNPFDKDAETVLKDSAPFSNRVTRAAWEHHETNVYLIYTWIEQLPPSTRAYYKALIAVETSLIGRFRKSIDPVNIIRHYNSIAQNVNTARIHTITNPQTRETVTALLTENNFGTPTSQPQLNKIVETVTLADQAN